MIPLVTIFTPTYNRAHILLKLYESLLLQQNLNFEWVIVDDGSQDNTKEIVLNWVDENKVPIVYEKKSNEGKHIAINRGVELAQGDLFFIVDSDDFLTPTATKLIENYYPEIRDNKELAGVSFRRGTDDSTFIGSVEYFEDQKLNVFDFRYRKNIGGDMAEVYKTAVLRNYSFPQYNAEKFCPESLVWNRIGLQYKMLWTSHIIYICNYLEGGLTSQIFEVRKKSPIASTQYYAELEKMPIPLLYKVKANINYWRFARFSSSTLMSKIIKVNPFISMIGLPFSLIFLIKDK